MGEDPLAVRGPGRARGHPRDPVPDRVRVGPARPARLEPHARRRGPARRAARARGRVPARVLRPRHARCARPVREGHGEVPHPLRVPDHRRRAHRAPGQALPPHRRRRAVRRHRPERRVRRAAAAREGRWRHQPRQGGRRAAHAGPGRRRRHQRVRSGDGRAGRKLRVARRLPRQRARPRPEPPRDHDDPPDPDPAAVLAAPRRARSQGSRAGRRDRLLRRCRDPDAVPLRLPRSRRRPAGARGAASPQAVLAEARGAGDLRPPGRRRGRLVVALRPHGDPDARHGVGPLGPGALPDLRARPTRARRASAARPRAQHVLGLLPVPDRSHGLGAAQLLRRADRRDRPDRDRGVRAVPDLAAGAPRGAASRGARCSRARAIRTRHARDRWPTACSRRCSARWRRTSST